MEAYKQEFIEFMVESCDVFQKPCKYGLNKVYSRLLTIEKML